MEHSDIVNKMISISYYYVLESMGKRRRLSTCRFIFCAHGGAHRFTAQC